MSYPPESVVLTPPPRVRFFADVRAAIRGAEHDYTEGPIGRALLLLAVPMVLETAMESLFALTDVFWVSRLGPEAVSTIGFTESLLTVVYALAIGLSIGVTAMVARRIGEKDADGAARATVQAVFLGLFVAAAIGVAGALFAPRILELMGAAPAVVAEGTGYARIMLGGNATVLLLFLLNAAFRGAGDAAIAMRVLWLANGINIVLDPLLIFGVGPFPELGMDGAAVATNVGRGTAVLIQLVTLARASGRLRVRRRHVRLEPAVMGSLVRLSATGTFQVFIQTASWVLLVRILADFGTAVVAGYTIAIRVIVFAILPSWGMSNAAATMVGQALGAGKPERAERSVWLAARYNVAFLSAVGLLLVVFAPQIVGAFTADPGPARWGVLCLRIVACGFPFYAYEMVLAQSFNGAGDPWTPTWINLGCFWAFELPLAWALSRGGLGPSGVFLAITLAYSAFAVVAAILFRRGTWKAKRV
jgi:putative MATE family efflux protein